MYRQGKASENTPILGCMHSPLSLPQFCVASAGVFGLRLVISSAVTSLAGKEVSAPKLAKLQECVFFLLWHSSSTLLNVSLLLSTVWFFDIFNTWEPLPSLCVNFRHHTVTETELLYYQTTLSFWFCSILLVFYDNRRKDFSQMVLHHVATVVLVLLSLQLGLFRFGQVVLLLHDLVDVFLYAAKAMHYLGRPFQSELLFGVFAVFFFLCRLVLFPWLAILPGWHCVAAELALDRGVHAGVLLPLLLSLLWLLHVYWFVLILRMAAKIFRGQQLGGDVRSDDENDHQD